MNKRAPAAEFVSFEFKTSRPWIDSELIHVDSFPLVYTETVREGFRVRLPGCNGQRLKSSRPQVVRLLCREFGVLIEGD